MEAEAAEALAMAEAEARRADVKRRREVGKARQDAAAEVKRMRRK